MKKIAYRSYTEIPYRITITTIIQIAIIILYCNRDISMAYKLITLQTIRVFVVFIVAIGILLFSL